MTELSDIQTDTACPSCSDEAAPAVTDGERSMLSLLPMAGHTRGKRSAVTCALKCDSACAKPAPNTSDNGYFRDIAGKALSRRHAIGLAGSAGAVLSGEEHLNGYFRDTGTSAAEKRYGLTGAASTYGWEAIEPRFDARSADYANEPNRFGYIVEIDPTDPTSTPRKHTMLGRLKHEGANIVIADNGHVSKVHTHLAGDKAGATKMDRCEDVEPSPKTGNVYVACTNNSQRGTTGKAGVDEANPRNTNRDGHVIEITEDDGDHTSRVFRWNLMIVAGDPATNASTYFAGYPKDKVSPISCPDNLAFDSEGNLWISTDGQPRSIQKLDGLFKVPLEGRERGHVQQFLAVPRDAETCGPVIHDRDGSVFVALQHPGEEGTWDVQNSLFPDYVEGTAGEGEFAGPRPSVVQVLKA